MFEKYEYDPYKGIKKDNKSEQYETFNNWDLSFKSSDFLNLVSHNESFQEHRLAWDSIQYNSHKN